MAPRNRRRPPTDPTSLSTVTDYRRRQERAYQLRLAGFSLQEVADAPDEQRGDAPLYASAGAAGNAIRAAMDRRTDSATTDRMRELAHHRYERLIRSLWAKAIGGDLWAHDRILRAMDQQARLLGLNAPAQLRTTVVTESAVDAEIQRLEAELTALGGSSIIDPEEL